MLVKNGESAEDYEKVWVGGWSLEEKDLGNWEREAWKGKSSGV